MRQCLDEGRLQSYFDGELSTEMMEVATSHLASCATCAAAASELEQESSLLSMALAAEFAVNVPTERLRQRIESTVAGLHGETALAPRAGVVTTLLSPFSNLFNFAPGRIIGFASLVAILAFGLIFGWLKFRTPVPVQPRDSTLAHSGPVAPNPSPAAPRTAAPENPTSGPPTSHVAINKKPNSSRQVAPKTPAVKLIPGERSYLQTIAKLDSTIKSGNKSMRPALQVEYERNLAVVDRAIAATRSAAKSNPNDPDAADFMFAAYQSKVDLLNTIADARIYNRSH
jgi:hypothetical protein